VIEAPLHPDSPAWFRKALDVKPSHHEVEVEGTPIRYLRWGTPGAPGLLLVHGNGASAWWWSFIAPYLAKEYCVAAINLGGMGDSGWRDHYKIETFGTEMLAVCDHAGFFDCAEPPVIVAHSFGGFCTVGLAASHGDKLAGVIIVDSPVNPPDRKGGPPNREFRPHNVYPSLEAALSRFRLAPPQPCENLWLVDYIAHTSLQTVEGGYSWKFDPKIWQRFELGDMSSRLKSITCRVGILRGEHSYLLPPEIGEYMFNLLDRAVPVVEIPDAHHHVMLDQPLATIAAIRALLADWDHSTPNRRRQA